MKTFNKELKAKLLKEIKKHEKADMIIQGTYGRGEGKEWKGCAVGCSLKSLNIIKKTDDAVNAHQRYEDELGIPRIIAKLEDGIFEKLSLTDSKKWPYEFMSAVPVGVDLSMVWPKFALWLLIDKKHGVIQYTKSERSKESIQKVANMYKSLIEGAVINSSDWRDAAAAAYADAAAAAYADAAAAAAAYAAYAAAADAAAAAADAAAAAAAAAYVAAADAAAADADAAYAADDWKFKRQEIAKIQAKKLIQLLKATK